MSESTVFTRLHRHLAPARSDSAAAERGMSTLALTDRDTVTGDGLLDQCPAWVDQPEGAAAMVSMTLPTVVLSARR
ncbi:hypothetical protein ACFYRC_38155 [Streptomyces sp. NPDC005279]|uniref:hypothetical protein n=1 Tax=Streptomyces sp. NPDC005279 TaxID=3364712 RepID=UPI0036C3476E